MPSNILIIEKNPILINNYEEFLSVNLKINHTVIDSFRNLKELLNSNTYSHLIINNNIEEAWIDSYRNIINLPTLVIAESMLPIDNYYVTIEPLTFDKVFSFISENSDFSFNTLEEYALDDQEIFAELKKQLSIEFEESFTSLPQLISEKNLTEIKNKVHQISSKFSLLEMNKSYEISREIDMNIIDAPENQLSNCSNLLVDLAVVIDQLKN